MRQSTYNVASAQRNIRALAGDHYVNTNLKLTKTVVAAKLVNGILPAGTVLAADGTIGTDTTAFGILFCDLDFNGSTGTEVASVMIHGFVDSAKVTAYSGTTPTAAMKAKMPLIVFL